MSPSAVERIVHQHELPLNAGDVVGEVEIAERLAVKVQTVSAWHHHATSRTAGRRHGFPPPRWQVSRLPAWYWPDVAEWAEATGRLKNHPHVTTSM